MNIDGEHDTHSTYYRSRPYMITEISLIAVRAIQKTSSVSSYLCRSANYKFMDK